MATAFNGLIVGKAIAVLVILKAVFQTIDMDAKPTLTDSSGKFSFLGDHLESIFRASFDLYGVLDEDGKIILMDGSLFERAGTNPDLLLGQIFTQTVYWQSSERTAKMFEKAIHDCLKGQCNSVKLDFRISSEHQTPIELSLVPITHENDRKAIFISGYAPDEEVGSFSQVDQKAEQLLLAAENADIGLWFWDFADDKIYSTPRCNELFEVPAFQQLTFQRFIEVVYPDDREFVANFFRASQKDGRKYEEEFRVRYSDGTVDWIFAEGKSVLGADGTPQKMMGVVRKITEQKLAAAELARANELAKRSRDEAIEANRAKDFFLAFVSHEIRSSLNAIIGWSRILLTKEVDEETRKNALETIERSARSQTKLINDLVDSARVASGKLRLEYRPIDICEVVRGAVETQRPAAEAAGINYFFITDIEQLSILGDSARLQQVFGNLISNALKFTPAGGTITVYLKTGAEAVTIDVEDSGAGISANALPGVFRQFSQVESGNFGGNTGLGLGLSIVKILTERHGGHVRAESHGIGKGSKFSVTLPINTTAAAHQDSSPNLVVASSKPLEGLKILIVEDNVDSREVLQIFLEKSGAKIQVAESAKVAFRLLSESRGRLPNLLISDLAMPDEDGYSLIARIRQLQESEGGDIPAIALSAFANEESRRRAFDAGFQRYATKPFDHDTLITDILKAVASDCGNLKIS